MDLVTQIRELLGIPPAGTPHSQAMTMQHLLGDLPPALKTSNNLALLEIYCLIPQPSVRHFVLVLLARITGDVDTTYPYGALSEAEYLLTQYDQLPTNDMRDKVLAMVRQVCAVNGGDI